MGLILSLVLDFYLYRPNIFLESRFQVSEEGKLMRNVDNNGLCFSEL